MKISYQDLISWFGANIKTLLVLELVCFMLAGGYFLVAPRIYEANFSISLPKVPTATSINPQIPRAKLLISPQEFIRPTQDPMAYSADFVAQCMGEDTNANRKSLINALQLGVKQQGDVIAFTLRLEGKERLFKCADLMMWRALNNLKQTQEVYLATQTLGPDELVYVAPAAMISAVRMSDSYIKPNVSKLLLIAALAGLFLTVFISALRKKYRA